MPKNFDLIYLDNSYSRNNRVIIDNSVGGLEVNISTNGYFFRFGNPLISSLHTEDNYNGSANLGIEISSNRLHLEKMSIALFSTGEWTKLDIEYEFDHVFGLGEKNGSLDKTGEEWEMWNSDKALLKVHDDPLYKSYPVVLMTDTKTWIGLIVDYPGYQKWDFTDKHRCRIYLNNTEFDMKIHVGTSPREVVSMIYQSSGMMELPPRWSMGYHQSRWSYFPASRALEVAKIFREKEIPLDAIYLDIDYMDGFRCFTWDQENFGDLKQLTDELHDLDVKVIAMIDPGIKQDNDYPIYREMIDHKLYVTNGKGPYIGKVWPGNSIFPDFFNPDVREWWGKKYKQLVEQIGIDGFWNDMNEPSVFDIRGTFPDDVIHKLNGDEIKHEFVHNLYGQMMVKASYKGLKSLYKKRIFLLSRSAYLGSQRFGWIWTGDNTSDWLHLAQSVPKLINSGLVGHMATGADIGGFYGQPSPELFARWIALGCFYPLMRTHTEQNTEDQEPWSYGSKVEQIARKFIRLRLELTPYIYTWFWYALHQGIPLLRPLWMEYPDENDCYDHKWYDTQFFFGPSILVAPILSDQTSRQVYLPPGTWYDYFTQETYEGNQIIDFKVDLDEIIMLVKENSIIPTLAKIEKNVETSWEHGFYFKKFGNSPSGFIYLDDGESFAYQDGKFGFYRIISDLEFELIEGEGYEKNQLLNE